MIRRFLLALFVLPFCAVALLGHASAQSISPARLTNALLTVDELNTILSAANVNATFSHTSDLAPQTGDRVGQCRIYASDNGYAAAICLFANADGSNPSTDLSNTILSGQALQNVALNTGIIDSIDNLALLGSTGLADNDQLASFTAVSSGISLDVLGDVFTQGPVAGYVFFASTSSADPSTMGGVLGAELAKLGS